MVNEIPKESALEEDSGSARLSAASLFAENSLSSLNQSTSRSAENYLPIVELIATSAKDQNGTKAGSNAGGEVGKDGGESDPPPEEQTNIEVPERWETTPPQSKAVDRDKDESHGVPHGDSSNSDETQTEGQGDFRNDSQGGVQGDDQDKPLKTEHIDENGDRIVTWENGAVTRIDSKTGNVKCHTKPDGTSREYLYEGGGKMTGFIQRDNQGKINYMVYSNGNQWYKIDPNTGVTTRTGAPQ